MKKIAGVAVLATIAMVALGTGQANATVGPAPVGTTCIGNCGTDTADGSVTLSPFGTPTYQFVSTYGGVTGAGEISGYAGTNGSSLQTAVFAAKAGDLLKFYFNYVTSDGGSFADYAFSQLLNADNSTAATLFTARTTSSGNVSPGSNLPANQSTLKPGSSAIIGGAPTWSPLGNSSNACYSGGCGYTGWIEADYTIQAAGTYSLLFGVTNTQDTSYDSGLAFDGVTVAGLAVSGTPVPEPASLALLGLGVAGVAAARRRRAV